MVVDLAQGMVSLTSIVPVSDFFLHVSYFWVKPLWRGRLD